MAFLVHKKIHITLAGNRLNLPRTEQLKAQLIYAAHKYSILLTDLKD